MLWKNCLLDIIIYDRRAVLKSVDLPIDTYVICNMNFSGQYNTHTFGECLTFNIWQIAINNFQVEYTFLVFNTFVKFPLEMENRINQARTFLSQKGNFKWILRLAFWNDSLTLGFNSYMHVSKLDVNFLAAVIDGTEF